jgi:hypothetical protein
MADVEEPLSKTLEFTTALGIFQKRNMSKRCRVAAVALRMLKSSARTGAVIWGRGSLGMECRVLASALKLALRVLLRDLEVAQGHADVAESQQLHESGQAG